MSFSIVQDHELVLAKEAAREAGRAPINLKPWRAWVSSTVRYDRRRRVAALSRTTLADCQKARSASIHDRCKAVYEGL